MQWFKRLTLSLAIVMGVLFVYTLATQTPRQGRGPDHDERDECMVLPGCVMAEQAQPDDPVGVFSPAQPDSAMADSIAPSQGPN